MARGLNVFVNIGAKLLPSLNSVATATERRFASMTRSMKLRAAEMKATMREINSASAGLAGMAAAGGLTWSVTKAIGEGAQLSHQLVHLRNAGRTSTEVAQAIAAANRTIASLPTTTLTDNIKLLNETTGAFGNFHHALENLTFNQRIGSMLHNQIGDKAGTSGEMFNNIVRAMEMRGSAQVASRYQREVGQLYRAMTFTGGRVNPEEFLGYMQQANPYMKGFSDRYLYKIAPSLIQEYGGDRAGTMQNTWTGTILGKAKNKIATEAWIKMGLLDPKEVVYNKVGPVGWRAGAVKGTDLALKDPLAWTEKFLIPALRKAGFNTADQLSMAKALMPLFRDRNANRLANTLVYDLDRQRLHKDEGLINRVPTVDEAYLQTARSDPMMAWGAITASLSNLSAAIFGTDAKENPIAIAMIKISEGINSIGAALSRHPTLAKGVGAVLLGSAGLAGLKLLGIGLRFALSPLTGIFRLLFSAGPRQIGIVGWVLRGLSRLGPLAMRALIAIGPWLLRGLAAAFGMLSNPVGWAIIAASAALLIYKYRDAIATGWGKLTSWFTTTAWPAVRDTVLGINWSSVGMSIADGMSFGLASKLPGIVSRVRGALPSWAPGATTAPAPRIAGKRAAGGPVMGGRLYLVGERGPELMVAPQSGGILSNGQSAALLRQMASGPRRRVDPVIPRDRRGRSAPGGENGPLVGTMNIYGQQDPRATAREVERTLKRYQLRQGGGLGD